MTEQEAIKLIGERTAELVKLPEAQKKMLEIYSTDGKEKAESWVYMAAIATLYFSGNEYKAI